MSQILLTLALVFACSLADQERIGLEHLPQGFLPVDGVYNAGSFYFCQGGAHSRKVHIEEACQIMSSLLLFSYHTFISPHFSPLVPNFCLYFIWPETAYYAFANSEKCMTSMTPSHLGFLALGKKDLF